VSKTRLPLAGAPACHQASELLQRHEALAQAVHVLHQSASAHPPIRPPPHSQRMKAGPERDQLVYNAKLKERQEAAAAAAADQAKIREAQ